MRTQDIITKVKRHRGPIVVEVSLNNDICHFQVSKPEMLFRLESIIDHEAECRIRGEHLVFGRSFNS